MSNPSNLQIATVEFSMKTSPRMELVEDNPLYREFILESESQASIRVRLETFDSVLPDRMMEMTVRSFVAQKTGRSDQGL